MNIKKHLSKLGLPCVDSVTGMTGVITSVSFDLYGCVQCIVHPGLNEKGELRESHWFDIARLEITSDDPVMATPDFDYGLVAEGRKGPADKPSMNKS